MHQYSVSSINLHNILFVRGVIAYMYVLVYIMVDQLGAFERKSSRGFSKDNSASV